MNNENFSAEQSLQLIQSMIERTKQKVKNNSFYFLLWGWLVFIAALAQFSLIRFNHVSRHYLVWNLMWVGVIASLIKGIKQGKKEKVKTYVGEAMGYFGISLGILYCGLAFIFSQLNLWEFSFPVYILIYAIACFFMGAVMQFPVLKWAGLFCLPVMVASVYFSFQWQLLLLALAVLIGYIIPGHIINLKYKHEQS